jgi:HEAT repeat protein
LVRGSAADALREIGHSAREAVPDLVKCLLEPVSGLLRMYFRLRVGHALWRISSEPKYLLAVGIEALHVEDWWLRHTAVARLGDLGASGEAAVPHLRWMLQDEHHRVTGFRSQGAGEDRGDGVTTTG